MNREEELRAWASEVYDPDDSTRLDFTSEEFAHEAFRESLRVIRSTLGAWWLKRELHERATQLGGMLGLDTPDHPAGPLTLYRIYNLAYELHEARGIPGFEAFVRGLRARSLRDATAELWAVRHCARAGEGAEFIDPNMSAGRSPDAVVILGGRRVPVEVKARVEQPLVAYDDRKIMSTLGGARKQLPGSGPSLIYLRLSPPWSEDEVTLNSVAGACDRFLANSRRVNAVVLMLERRLPHPDGEGMAFRTATLTIPSHNPRVRLDDIQQ